MKMVSRTVNETLKDMNYSGGKVIKKDLSGKRVYTLYMKGPLIVSGTQLMLAHES